tara:strand:+ start:782 stop:1249 length:468 start_codon:yes stop_codon:yes gene_type:complete
MNIFDNFEKIIINFNLLINEVWKLVFFQSDIQESTLIVIIWSVVVYIVGIIILLYLLKIIIEGILRFIFNPITILFFIFILGLLLWTILQLNKEFKISIKTDNEQSNNLTLPKVEIEKTNPIKDDQAISERLKQIERLEEMIKKQQETIKVLRNN